MLHLGKLLAFPTNTRLGCKGLQETNTLAYSESSSITDVNSFITLSLERVVHAKGAGAFGHFKVTHDITDLCKVFTFVHNFIVAKHQEEEGKIC